MIRKKAIKKKEKLNNQRDSEKSLLKKKNKKTHAKKYTVSEFFDDFRKLIKKYDMSILFIVVILSLFGIAMVYSAGFYQTINTSDPDPLYYLKKQTFHVLTGLVLMLVFANVDYRIYSKYASKILILSVVLLVAVLLIGININGATRWLGIGPIRITPSEISKLAVIIFTAVYISKDPECIKKPKDIGILSGVAALHFILIAKQPNLSTAIVIVMIIFSMMFVAGLAYKFFALLIGFGAVGYVYILTVKKPYHWYIRLTSFMNPFADSQGDGYQVTQGLIALGNGEIRGLGFGKSLAKSLYLPEPQNDFILAIIGEELGYIGITILMIGYLILIYRLILVTLKARDLTGFYLGTGITAMLGLQIIINVAVVTSSMPATGITLPFISAGGMSIWVFMVAIGIMLNISRKQRQRERKVQG